MQISFLFNSSYYMLCCPGFYVLQLEKYIVTLIFIKIYEIWVQSSQTDPEMQSGYWCPIFKNCRRAYHAITQSITNIIYEILVLLIHPEWKQDKRVLNPVCMTMNRSHLRSNWTINVNWLLVSSAEDRAVWGFIYHHLENECHSWK